MKAPMLNLLDVLSERFEKAGIPLRGDKRGMFRIHRDVRFAKDKLPYQTHASAVLTPTGTQGDPGLVYVHISADGLSSWSDGQEGSFMAPGFHQPDKDVLSAV